MRTLQLRKVIYQIPCSGCDKTYTGQAAFSEQGSKNTEALSGGTIQIRSRTTLHGHRPHLQLAGHPYPWICQLPKSTRSDRSPTFGRTQRESIYAIRYKLQVNASAALINIPRLLPFFSPLYSSHLINQPPIPPFIAPDP